MTLLCFCGLSRVFPAFLGGQDKNLKCWEVGVTASLVAKETMVLRGFRPHSSAGRQCFSPGLPEPGHVWGRGTGVLGIGVGLAAQCPATHTEPPAPEGSGPTHPRCPGGDACPEAPTQLHGPPEISDHGSWVSSWSPQGCGHRCPCFCPPRGRSTATRFSVMKETEPRAQGSPLG